MTTSNLKSDKKWISAHLYYSGSLDEFLINGVNPFLAEINNNDIIKKFFFVRYWDKGQHLRLRILADPGSLNRIKSALSDFFRSYFSKYPSTRKNVDSRWASNLLPNDSIQYISYEPETNRYGGPLALKVAESQFHHSSSNILRLMKEFKSGWEYNVAMGVAIKLHINFVAALGLDLSQFISFFTKFSQGWLPSAYLGIGQNLSEEEATERYHETMQAFSHTYNKQREKILIILRNSLHEVSDELMLSWRNQMTSIAKELNKLASKSKIETPVHFKYDENLNVDINQQMIWNICHSYVHMTNNRLGILNRDEAYLGYLMCNGLNDIMGYSNNK